jgi:LuxR family transcriptional regulator, maltose regulon positive regulatory protein
LLTLLLNDLGALTTPLALILDDYHLITAPSIHEAVVFLIDHLPPQMQMVITTRLDPALPLARWRVRNQLADVRADDLRFSPTEAALFLNEVMGLTLSAAEISALEARTEGWIAGQRLQAQAATIGDETLRQSFLENIKVNRLIRELYATKKLPM